jgi:glutamate/aspartate transport system substrate-binding protein
MVRSDHHREILLAGMVANSQSPRDWRIIDDALRVEPYGLILRKDDPEFKAGGSHAGELVESVEFEKLYANWFMSPIPPKNVNLNFPMTPPLEDALAHPNDRGV